MSSKYQMIDPSDDSICCAELIIIFLTKKTFIIKFIKQMNLSS